MKTSYYKIIFSIFALFLSPEVLAISVFDVLPTDKSLEYLGIIFGGSVGVITLSGDANPMLSKMFEQFNFIIVTVGVVVLSYIGIAAAVNTAREGESMGKKFSLWVPLRAMLGMLLMVPSPGTGYSVVQMTVMWVVLNGIGAANTIWNVVLDQLASGIKASGKIELPISDTDLFPTVEAVLKASTCMQLLNNTPNLELTQKYGRVKPITIYNTFQKPTSASTQIERSALINIGVEGSPNPADSSICGSFKVKTVIIKGDKKNAFNLSSLDARLGIKVNAIVAMFSAVESATDILRMQKLLPTDPTPELPEPGYVRAAINAYKNQMVNLAQGVRNEAGWSGPSDLARGLGYGLGALGGPAGIAVGGALAEVWERPPDNIPIASQQIAIFKRLGWIHAGSYYYSLSKTTGSTLDLDALTKADSSLIPNVPLIVKPTLTDPANLNNPPPTWTASRELYTALTSPTNRAGLIDVIDRVNTYFTKDKPTQSNSLPELGSGKVSSGNGFVDEILSGISDKIRKPIIDMFQSAFSGQKEDPLISIGKFGWEIMMSGELSIFIAIILAFGISMVTSPASCLNPAAYAANQLLLQIFIVVFTFLALMWTLGATMGVYMPLIPYLIFTGTAVGWLLAVIEAIVAAPLIALSMVQPGGEELGGLKPPLLILANLFLRPSLMIFGFVVAASFLRAILTMINFGFSRAVEESVIPTLFGIVPILGIYAGFVIALINQAFGLIYELPNRVMRYMGGGRRQ